MVDSSLVPAISARSAVLSLLLALHPPSLSTREIIAAMELFGISEPTTRVALTRMVAAGDLIRDESSYTLSERLLHRQRDVEPPVQRRWRGTWELAIVTTSGRSAADRTALRREMQRQRVAELREGVWTRPANLRREWPQRLLQVSTCFEARPTSDSAALAARLWDLDGWAAAGRAFVEALDETTDEPSRFRTMVAAVRHLQSDPLLPAELLPTDWPVEALSVRYADYRSWVGNLGRNR
ncbi:PaaX domain-containing protein, C- domain protein [Flexivirga aerilata]|uniref:PaaX domain-containing protein, C- domain protein n=1 Tax=Flexivirga aerilata TaxID=1656889 RepID=UPI001BB22118